VLVTIKGNYTRKGEKIHIQWRDGIFWPEGVQTTLQRSAANAAIDEAFLRCLDVATSHGRTVRESGGHNYAPKLFADMPEAQGIKAPAFKLAMARVLSAGTIKIENNGKRPPLQKVDR